MYSDISINLTNQLSKQDKRNNGIYFTPPDTVEYTLDNLKDYISNIKTILEPSCGSGEYITAIQKRYPKTFITGIEYNSTIVKSIQYLSDTYTKIISYDFIKYDSCEKYDLIIGNPPYFVMKKKDVEKKYYPYFDGRPNMFILFIIKSIQHLNENGILSFILPKSFNNCLYYDKTRNYLEKTTTILYLNDCHDKYLETQQDTILLILQKKKPTQPSQHTLHLNNYTLYTTIKDKNQLETLLMGSQSLHQLGFKVRVGNVVWNQCKSILTDDNKETRLIYSSDIHEGHLTFKTYKHPSKKNFIKKPGETDPILVVNRGYGMGTYKFDYCLIEGDFDYLIENHLIVIYPQQPMEKEILMIKYREIIKSLKDTRTTSFIKLYFGNNAINTTELNYILPIYTNR